MIGECLLQATRRVAEARAKLHTIKASAETGRRIELLALTTCHRYSTMVDLFATLKMLRPDASEEVTADKLEQIARAQSQAETSCLMSVWIAQSPALKKEPTE